ncbi:MAG TPA: prepilin peptidase [Candidatus Saccharimonadales bacterium]
MEIAGYIVSGFFGLVMGSFAGASVWRLRARQLLEDKAEGESYDKKELKRLQPLTGKSFSSDRSQCLHCHHELAWYDLLPLVSWLSTGGTCRYCKKPIGWFEPLMELSTAVLFILFYHFWLTTMGLDDWYVLLLWVPVLVMMMILLAYDWKWFLLPDKVMFPLIAVSGVIATLGIASSSDLVGATVSAIGAVGILGGLYLVLWLLSRGTWVGFGDVKLGLALGLLLGDWMLAFLALFLANCIGLLVALPGLLTKKMSRKTHIPFGPMLIVGSLIALLYGYSLIQIYFDVSNSFVNYTLML